MVGFSLGGGATTGSASLRAWYPTGRMPESNKFGRYEVEEEVARGGMGVIYRVRDPEMRRFLAMKVLISDLGEGHTDDSSRRSNLVARFTDEAQLTGQLDHPGIIPVYDMGKDEQGRLFFTMRMVKGRTLEEIFELVREGREGWTVTRALGVLQKVCEAMAFAHDRGVIHRDLKPANVMVGRFGETYVMDWGLGKLVGEEEAPSERHDTSLQTVLSSARKDESSRGGELATLDGDVMGTPAYMPPEQARGEMERMGPRSDVYAVGAMLYHLLSGHAPYRPPGAGVLPVELLRKLLAGPPEPVAQAAPSVPAELCAICERAMAREPEQRYAGMVELGEDLQAYVENRVVQAYRGGAVVEFKKWVQRNRAIAASLAALFVIVVAGLVAVSVVQTRAREQVESKNQQLAETNEELQAERARTIEARDRAELNRERAVESEQLALANEREALWQSYVGNVGAALAALEIGSASEARRRLAACPEDLRGWEWAYLDQRADGSLRTLTGSETFVFALAVSPVEPHVAAGGGMDGNSGTPDYAVRIWDHESGELLHTLEGHRATVTSIAYSPAGDTLATADLQGNLRLWDARAGEVIATAQNLGSKLAYHPDGRRIATASYFAGVVVLWDSYDLTEVGRVRLPAGTNALRISPDGERIAVAGRDQHLRVLDEGLAVEFDFDVSRDGPETGVELRTAGHVGPGVYDVDFAPDGRRLVTGSDDGFVRTWDLATGQRLLLLDGHASTVQAARWHPRFNWLVSSDSSGSVRFWDSETGRPLDVLRGHDEDVHALGFTPLGDRLLTVSRDHTVRVWDGQAGANDTLLEGLAFPNFAPYQLSFSSDSERIAWRSGLNAFAVTDVRTGEDLVSRWTYDAFNAIALEYLDDGVWEAESRGNLSRWDSETGELTADYDFGWFLICCAFQAEPRTALVAGVPREGRTPLTIPGLKRIDLTTGDELWTVTLPMVPTQIWSSPDGTRCLVQGSELLGEGQRVALFDTSDGTLLWHEPSAAAWHWAEFFPDGERFASTSFNLWDNQLSIHDAQTGEVLDEFVGHAQPAHLDISPDGSRIVTGNWDGTLSLWSPERGQVVALQAHASHTSRVGFSPDGMTIASVGQDGVRRFWSATDAESRQDTRRAAARRRRWSVDARARVAELMERRVHSSAVVAALEADRTLLAEQRDAAILLARSVAADVSEVMSRAVAIGLDPDRPAAEYMAALEGSNIMLQRLPDVASMGSAMNRGLAEDLRDMVDMSAVPSIAALVQVRLGFHREAFVNLEHAATIHAFAYDWPNPFVELVTSLAHLHLGEVAEAERAYDSAVTSLARHEQLLSPEVVEVLRQLAVELGGSLGRD